MRLELALGQQLRKAVARNLLGLKSIPSHSQIPVLFVELRTSLDCLWKGDYAITEAPRISLHVRSIRRP